MPHAATHAALKRVRLAEMPDPQGDKKVWHSSGDGVDLVTHVDGEGRASCRSIEEFDITALLRRHADLFLRFGGHRAAAGFTIDASRLPELRARLTADAASRLDVANLAPTIPVDAELHLGEVNKSVLQWLALLGPHGIGNPTPTFLARGVTVADARAVGAEGTHLSFTLKEGPVTWRAISFGNPVVTVERTSDGTIYLRSRRALGDYPLRLTDRLHHWADIAPERVFMAEREGGRGWRELNYAELLASSRRIASALLNRGLSTERPVVIISRVRRSPRRSWWYLHRRIRLEAPSPPSF